MKKTLKISILLTMAYVFIGCQPQTLIVGRSTMNPIFFNQLDLKREHYEILKTVTAEAKITVYEYMGGLKIVEENNEFEVMINGSKVNVKNGVLKFGYLANDIGHTTQVSKGGLAKPKQSVQTYLPTDPETYARRLAKYRLINEAKAMDGDGVIEPVISSDIAVTDKRTTVIKTTIAAKIIVLKTDR
ncbi:MAG: hypothetical protein PF489_12170 [Salinivirgaceae bacterium]|jgi:hypothetical protein|nr:hypothetical protein [Salinivirgaceae bacterium]